MENSEAIAIIAQMHLVKSVDSARAAGDVFKLPTFLRSQHDADLAALESADTTTALAEGDRAGGSVAVRAALSRMEVLLKEGYNFIKAIRSSAISEASRLEVFTAYGWAGGKMGRFDDSRVVSLARLGVTAHPGLQAAWCYAADLVTDLTAQLAVFDAKAVVSTGGGRESATRAREEKMELAKQTLAQVRFYYCCASRDIDRSPELTKVGFQPRRASGEAAPAHKATPPAPVTPPSNTTKAGESGGGAAQN